MVRRRGATRRGRQQRRLASTLGTDTGQPDAGLGDAVAGHFQGDRDAGGREVADSPFELEVATGPGARAGGITASIAISSELSTVWNGPETKSFTGIDRLPLGPRGDLSHRGHTMHDAQSPCGIGVADRADERAAGAHDRVGDQRSRGGDGRLVVASVVDFSRWACRHSAPMR